MKTKKIIPILFILIFYLVFFVSCGFAEYTASDTQDGRYVLVTIESEGIYAKTLQRKIPAIVLDTVRGIVWRCQNLAEEKPVWIKTDLGKNSDASLSKKRYIVKIPTSSSNDLKIPAIVLDTEEGKTWTCRDITSPDAIWVEKDLPKDIK